MANCGKPRGAAIGREPVISSRSLSFRLTLSSLTGILLLAIGLVCPDLRVHDPRPAAVAEVTSQSSQPGDRNSTERRTVLAAAFDVDADDEEQPRVASLDTIDRASDRLAILATTLTSYRRAPLSHRPCAFPPTGPPHA